uniref:Uncharacterized protein n=1 Tax=Panagrolaimus davidi TaxID=227884 RepID=A0A914QFV0_9BILA
MVSFGIRNHSSDSDAALINWCSFSNILKPEIEHVWPQLLNGEEINLPLELNYDESKDLCFPGSTKPLLYEHFEHLTFLWKDLKTKSFITNRRTMRLLTDPIRQTEFELMAKEMTVENEKRIFYIFNEKSQPYVEDVKPVNAIYSFTQRTSDIGYTEYCCKTKTFNGFDFYYTSKIDAYHSSSGCPIELKSLQDHGNYDLSPKLSYQSAIQCYLADVDKI